MPILGGVTTAPPAIESAQWNGMGHTWTAGGVTFDLTDVDAGIVLCQGVRGLGMPTFDRWTIATPSLAGSRYTGSRTQERTTFWPVWVFSDTGSADWLARDRALWSTIRPDVKGTWRVTQANGEFRSLDLRFADDSDQSFTLDPSRVGWSLYGINGVADDNPYWYSDPIVRDFVPPSTTSFFMSSGGVFFISPGGTTDTATIPNPGDVDAWPVLTVSGATSGMTIGIGSGSIVVPAIADGVTWVIDTHPSAWTAIDQSGTDHSAAVTWNPAPIPTGSEVALSLTINSPGTNASIIVSVTPLYFRAW